VHPWDDLILNPARLIPSIYAVVSEEHQALVSLLNRECERVTTSPEETNRHIEQKRVGLVNNPDFVPDTPPDGRLHDSRL